MLLPRRYGPATTCTRRWGKEAFPLISPEEVHSQLVSAFPGAEIEVVDLTGTRDHYQARVVSAAFAGKSPVEQHQLVYRALGGAMDGPIHALALRTYTPEVWDELKRGSV